MKVDSGVWRHMKKQKGVEGEGLGQIHPLPILNQMIKLTLLEVSMQQTGLALKN